MEGMKMKNVFKSFAALAAILSFAACQKEVSPVEPAQNLYYVSFIAEEPATKTTVAQATDEEGNKVAVYSWTASDASADRWTVYRGSDVAESVTPSLSNDGVMTITAGFKTTSTTGDKFVALFNKGINAVQNITSESVYDPTSDVMISAEVPYEEGVVNYGFRFNRLGAVAKATVKGLTGMAALTDAKLIATDGTILAADYDYSEKAFASTGSTNISVKGIDCDPDANGYFSYYFITVPTESVNIKMLVSALDDQAEEHLFVKQLGKAIGFEKGNVHAFNVSGFAEVTTKANFNVNGNVKSKPTYQGEPVEFPQNPDPINGYDFVGWSKSEISGTQQEKPEMVDVETEVMGNADVTYYAVFAKTTGHGTATNAITYDTTNIPTAYGDAADITLNDVVFNVTQMYKNGEKMQWKASTGTMYNKDALPSIQSIAITYHSSDSQKNFTVNVGDSANPTSGTAISASQVGETDTYVYDCSSSSPSYFVLKNGANAGYLTSIVITYLGGEPIYSDYCTSIDTRIVTTLSWSAPTATVKLNGDDNEFPTLTADPEEVEAGVEYSSSETSVATINANGEITLIATGETTVTATFPEGDEAYQPSSASYTLIVTAPAAHIVTFSINGQTSTQEFDENDPIIFPEDPKIDGVVFRGWSKTTISGTQQDAPEMVNTKVETMGNADITYYAVFAKETKASTYTDSKLSSNSFKSNSTYVLAAAESSSATTLHYFSSYTGTTANESWGVTSTTADDAISFTLSGTADALVAKDASGNYLQALATGKFRMSSSSTTLTLKNDGTIYNPTSGSTGYNLRYNHNNGSGGFRWYNGTTGTSAYFYERVADITYSNYCTTVITLSSVAVSGTPSKTNYKAGETFDVDGLVATAVYSDGDSKPVTDDVEWTITPAGALTAGTTSVSVVAKYGKVSSDAYQVSITVTNVTFEGISIKTAPTKVNYTVGEKFDPAGLVITRNYSDETSDEYAYAGNESDFTFNPTLNAELATTDTKVTITYKGKTVDQAITVKSIANTKETAYTVSEARALIDAGKDLDTEVYVKGKVSKIVTAYDSSYGNISFNISANGSEEGDQFQFFRNFKGADKTKWTDADTKPAVGNEVIGFGKLTKFGSTYEFAEGNYIVSITEVPYLKASASKNTVAAAGEEVIITVDTNIEDWTVSSDNAAFVVGAKSGKTVPVVVSKNTSTTDERTAHITVSATGVEDVVITLTQAKAGESKKEATLNSVSTKEVVSTKGGSVSKSFNNVTCQITRNSGNQPGFYTSSGIVRYYSADVMKLSVPSGYVITRIELTYTSGATSHSVDVGNLSTDGSTWTGSSQSVQFIGSGTVKIDSIKVIYSAN